MPKRKSTHPEQSPKKAKVVSPEKSTPNKSNYNQNQENINWPNQDILELLTKIEENIPKDDFLSHTSRLEKFEWENIKVKSYSTSECKKVFTFLHKKVRKFRLLRELVNDMKELARGIDNTPKPPKKPKRPPNNYMLFLDENRYKIMKENPTAPPTELAKLFGQAFKNLPSEEKERFDREAKIKQEEYSVTLQHFYDEHPELLPKKLGRNCKPIIFADGLGPPKKPKTPFELFMQVESEKDETGDSKNVILQKCRESWHNFNDREKYFWINWADELYMKYMEDIKEYIKKHPTYEPGCVKPVLNKTEIKIKERCCGKPDKPPQTPYHLFSKMLLETEEVKKIDTKDCMVYVAERWRNCSEDEKNEYKIRVEQMWDEYQHKLEAYLATLPPEDRDRVRAEATRKVRNEQKPFKTTKAELVTKVTKPISPPSTPYKYFLKMYKGNKDPSLVWKKLSQEEKDKYEEELTHERTKYISLYEVYLKSLSREELEKFATQTNQYSSSSDSDTDD